MRITTATNLYKLFKEYDEDTILRVRNIRTLIQDNNFEYHRAGEVFLIDYDAFMQKVNQKNISHRYDIPRIRSIQSATREYNKSHNRKISYHIVEQCIASKEIPFVKTPRLYLINYDELEKYLEKKHFEMRVKEI